MFAEIIENQRRGLSPSELEWRFFLRVNFAVTSTKNRRYFFCMNSTNLVLCILGREQNYAPFSSIDEFQGKNHHRNVHTNKYHI